MNAGNPQLESELRQYLQATAHIPATDVADMLARHEITIEALLVALLPLAAERACAPVSGFHVGAAALGLSSPGLPSQVGAIYLGANGEFHRVPLSMTIHAEQSAINNAWLSGEVGLQAIAVTAAPCGFCRQFLWELNAAENLSVLIASGAETTREKLSELLPRPFGPRDLGLAGGLMTPKTVTLRSEQKPVLPAALEAAAHSYAPYTGNYAGLALQFCDGGVVTGRAGENAAFNPSLSPLQSAIAAATMIRPSQPPTQIERAVLVECPKLISYRTDTEAFLRRISPGIEFQYVEANVTVSSAAVANG